MTPGVLDNTPKLRVGEALIDAGELTEDQLREALSEQKRSGRRLGEVLVERGLVTLNGLVKALARTQGVRGVRLRHGLVDPKLLKLIGPDEAERLRALPLFRVRDELTVALAEPRNLAVIDRISEMTGFRVRPVLALEGDIVEFARKYAGDDIDVDEFLTSLSESDIEVIEREAIDEQTPEDLATMVDGSPVVNLVNLAVLQAVRDGASDIHFEPSAQGTRIRYRIDGVLRDLMRPPQGMHASIVSRVKVIGRMDIAEKRLPQEGRVRMVAEGRQIDLRVSSMPTLLGEKLVVRVLDKSNLRVRLDELGFREASLQTFLRGLNQPHGLVLVTGPTGSGKTTTLYSALDLLRSPERNIVTVEDPVEYQLDLVNQIQVSEGIGLTFARALRSILRQDPDVVMVGEIRDQETARVGVQAALTGHLVLATLHTNDAPSTIARLCDMGVESYLISSAINTVVAQRLARRVCPNCCASYFPSADELADAGIPEMAGRPFKHGEGCRACHDSGFRGRVGVYEVLEATPRIKRLISQHVQTHVLRNEHIAQGGRALRQEAVAAALDGFTSLEEALRVTRSDQDDEAAAPPPPAAPPDSESHDPDAKADDRNADTGAAA